MSDFDWLAFARAVWNMRKHQKRYFISRSTEDLKASKGREEGVDRLLAEIVDMQKGIRQTSLIEGNPDGPPFPDRNALEAWIEANGFELAECEECRVPVIYIGDGMGALCAKCAEGLNR